MSTPHQRPNGPSERPPNPPPAQTPRGDQNQSASRGGGDNTPVRPPPGNQLLNTAPLARPPPQQRNLAGSQSAGPSVAPPRPTYSDAASHSPTPRGRPVQPNTAQPSASRNQPGNRPMVALVPSLEMIKKANNGNTYGNKLGTRYNEIFKDVRQVPPTNLGPWPARSRSPARPTQPPVPRVDTNQPQLPAQPAEPLDRSSDSAFAERKQTTPSKISQKLDAYRDRASSPKTPLSSSSSTSVPSPVMPLAPLKEGPAKEQPLDAKQLSQLSIKGDEQDVVMQDAAPAPLSHEEQVHQPPKPDSIEDDDDAWANQHFDEIAVSIAAAQAAAFATSRHGHYPDEDLRDGIQGSSSQESESSQSNNTGRVQIEEPYVTIAPDSLDNEDAANAQVRPHQNSAGDEFVPNSMDDDQIGGSKQSPAPSFPPLDLDHVIQDYIDPCGEEPKVPETPLGEQPPDAASSQDGEAGSRDGNGTGIKRSRHGDTRTALDEAPPGQSASKESNTSTESDQPVKKRPREGSESEGEEDAMDGIDEEAVVKETPEAQDVAMGEIAEGDAGVLVAGTPDGVGGQGNDRAAVDDPDPPPRNKGKEREFPLVNPPSPGAPANPPPKLESNGKRDHPKEDPPPPAAGPPPPNHLTNPNPEGTGEKRMHHLNATTLAQFEHYKCERYLWKASEKKSVGNQATNPADKTEDAFAQAGKERGNRFEEKIKKTLQKLDRDKKIIFVQLDYSVDPYLDDQISSTITRIVKDVKEKRSEVLAGILRGLEKDVVDPDPADISDSESENGDLAMEDAEVDPAPNLEAGPRTVEVGSLLDYLKSKEFDFWYYQSRLRLPEEVLAKLEKRLAELNPQVTVTFGTLISDFFNVTVSFGWNGVTNHKKRISVHDVEQHLTTNAKWHVVDTKSSKKSKITHMIQIALYHSAFENYLSKESQTLLNFEADFEGAIWLPTIITKDRSGDAVPPVAQTPEAIQTRLPINEDRFPVHLWKPIIDQLLEYTVPDVLAMKEEDLSFHFNGLCRTCKYKTDCRDDASKRKRLGALADISLADEAKIRNLLATRDPKERKASEIEDIEDLITSKAGELADTPIWKDVSRIFKVRNRRNSDLKVVGAKSVVIDAWRETQDSKTGVPKFLVADGLRPELPAHEDFSLFISLLFNPNADDFVLSETAEAMETGAVFESLAGYALLLIPRDKSDRPGHAQFSTTPKEENAEPATKPSQQAINLAQSLVKDIYELLVPFVDKDSWDEEERKKGTERNEEPKRPKTKDLTRLQTFCWSNTEASFLNRLLTAAAIAIDEPGAATWKKSREHVRLCVASLVSEPCILLGKIVPNQLDCDYAGNILEVIREAMNANGKSVPKLHSRKLTSILGCTSKEGAEEKVKEFTSKTQDPHFPRIIAMEDTLRSLGTISVPGYSDLSDYLTAYKIASVSTNDELLGHWKQQKTETLEGSIKTRLDSISLLLDKIRTDVGDKLLYPAPPFKPSLLTYVIDPNIKRLWFMSEYELLCELRDLHAKRSNPRNGLLLKYEGSRDLGQKSLFGGTDLWAKKFAIVDAPWEFFETGSEPMYDCVLVRDSVVDGEQRDAVSLMEGQLDPKGLLSFGDLREHSKSLFSTNAKIKSEFTIAYIHDIDFENKKCELVTSFFANPKYGDTFRLHKRVLNKNHGRVLKTLWTADQADSTSVFRDLIANPDAFGPKGSKAPSNADLWIESSNAIEKTWNQFYTLGGKDIEEKVFKMKPSQRSAYKRFAESGLTVIWGPPGAGKTHCLALLCLRSLQTVYKDHPSPPSVPEPPQPGSSTRASPKKLPVVGDQSDSVSSADTAAPATPPKPSLRILFTATTNAALYNFVAKIYDLLKKFDEETRYRRELPKGEFEWITDIRSNIVLLHSAGVMFGEAHILKALEQLSDESRESPAGVAANVKTEGGEISDRNAQAAAEKRNQDLVICVGTPWQVYNHFHAKGSLDPFDVVITDEASQMPVSHAAIPIGLAKKKGSTLKRGEPGYKEDAPPNKGSRLVFAGDHLQLPPILKGQYLSSENLDPVFGSIMTCLMRGAMEKDLVRGLRPKNPRKRERTLGLTSILTENFRMDSALAEFAQVQYEEEFKTSNSAARERRRSALLDYLKGVIPERLKNEIREFGLQEVHAYFVDLAKPTSMGTLALSFDGGDAMKASYEVHVNRECELVAKVIEYIRRVEHHQRLGQAAEELEQAEPLRIFAATPHRIQRTTLEQVLRKRLPTELQCYLHRKYCRIDTSDRLQGDEADIVIVDYGYTSYHTNTTIDETELDFTWKTNRLHVSITRAKSLCILVAPRQYFTMEDNDKKLANVKEAAKTIDDKLGKQEPHPDEQPVVVRAPPPVYGPPIDVLVSAERRRGWTLMNRFVRASGLVFAWPIIYARQADQEAAAAPVAGPADAPGPAPA